MLVPSELHRLVLDLEDPPYILLHYILHFISLKEENRALWEQVNK